MKIFATVLFVICFATGSWAQDTNKIRLSNAEKEKAVQALQTALGNFYVYQDKVADLVMQLDKNFRSGTYRNVHTAQEFSDALTKDLIDITDDYHFAVIYDPDGIAASRKQESDSESAYMREDVVAELKLSNFGFRQLQILEGNIGYIRFDYFPDPEHSFEAGASAMKFVENTDALIFDMRYNRGGHNQFAQFLSSYLFDASEEILLLEYDLMTDGECTSGAYWTMPALPGSRKPEVPVYILTSTTTFSAAEWFAYSLQKLSRATIVGQQSSGASHAVERKPIDDRFLLQVPVGRVKDPVDKGDFEGVGVIPDHMIASIQAKAVAHRMAFEAISLQSEVAQDDYQWMQPVLEARISKPVVSLDRLKMLAGEYEGRRIEVFDGQLMYHWRDRFNLSLRPLTPDLFAIEGIEDFRFRFIEENGAVSRIERIEKDGRILVYNRTN